MLYGIYGYILRTFEYIKVWRCNSVQATECHPPELDVRQCKHGRVVFYGDNEQNPLMSLCLLWIILKSFILVYRVGYSLSPF